MARRREERTVGSPPESRSWAPDTSAPLKNTPTTFNASAVASPTRARVWFMPPLPPSAGPEASNNQIAGTHNPTSTTMEQANESTGMTRSSRSFLRTCQETFANSIVLEIRPTSEIVASGRRPQDAERGMPW
mgnify:CR=1 FL=1